MKHNPIKIRPVSLALLLAGIGLAPAALAVDLVAIEGTWTDGTTSVPMWGFATDTGQACTSNPAWGVGPQLTTDGAGNLTVNLRNCLGESVSLVIPGNPAATCDAVACAPRVENDAQGRPRVRAFTTEAAASGGTMTYTFTGIGDGTYLYQSGTHPAKQVQMGLYGALTQGTYPDTHDEVTLLYSEIDPELHSPPAAATPLGYNPKHYLVNGSTSVEVADAGDTNHPTVLRFLNAGLDFHVPALNSGYMDLVAEDGHAYPFAKRQYSVNLAAGKSIDALWHAPEAGDYVIYDRRGHGMVASLTAIPGPAESIAVDDAYSIAEDGTLNVTPAALGVLNNDTDSGGVAMLDLVPAGTASIVSSTSAGILTLGDDGTLVYTPNADFNGDDTFTYRADDGVSISNVATVTITVDPVNDTPVADANGPYAATPGDPVTLDGTGSSDIDGDVLTYAWDFDYDGVTFNPTGVGATPVTTYALVGSYDVALVVSDSTVDSTLVTSTVDVAVAVNAAPVAQDDYATMQRNTTAFINLTDNDSDPDGNLKTPSGTGSVAPAQITITTGSIGTRGGTVAVTTNGVNFTPKKNFRGTDTFNYTVADLDGAVSNEVTVRVNVTK